MSKIGIKASLDVTPQGARFSEAWLTISRAAGTASSLSFDVEFYASEQAFDQGYQPLLLKAFTIPYQSGDLVTLLYAHLLTLNLDESQHPNTQMRLKCNISAGELIQRDDPELPQGEHLEEDENLEVGEMTNG